MREMFSRTEIGDPVLMFLAAAKIEGADGFFEFFEHI